MTRLVATVVVPAWNAWERTERCLDSLLPTLGADDQVVVVDNGSGDQTAAGLRARPWVDVLSNPDNRGFAAACNQGAAVARGGVVVFLNSDTMVAPGWLDRLLEPFGDSEVGATGPRSNFVSGPQLAPSGTYDPTDPASFAAFAAAWTRAHAGERFDVERLVGFCLAVRRVAFDSVGGFDEGFRRGGYEDDDLCRRLRHAGWRLVVAGDAYVHHDGHASFDANGVDWQSAELESRERFVAKHSSGSRRPLVSLCMIVRDEEEFLPSCLDSVEGTVDEVVIADTGSVDQTVALAEARSASLVAHPWEDDQCAAGSARVLRLPWRDDFAAARNEALSACTGEWVLWLDADETLDVDAAGLRALLRQTPDDVDGYVLRIENRMGSGLGSPTVHAAVRLFRRERCHWVGRLHEQVLRRDRPDATNLVMLAGGRIVHSGYLDRVLLSRAKRERNLRLAEAAMLEVSGEVEQAFRLFNLGRTKLAAGDAQGAVPLLRDAASLTENEITRRTALWVLGEALLLLGDHEAARKVAAELRAVGATSGLADVIEARAHLGLGRPADALSLLEPLEAGQSLGDGFELGAGPLGTLRAKALAALGRPGEAADEVLSILGRFGVLELGLGEVLEWLEQAGRSADEVAERIEAGGLWTVAAMMPTLEAARADQLAEALWGRFPRRMEVLAGIGAASAGLSVERLLVWSSRRRQVGLDDCPLLERAADPSRLPDERLLAAAVAHGAFLDERAISLAQAAFAALSEPERPRALARIERIAPGLAAALAGHGWTGPMVKVNLGGGDDRRQGYLTVDLRRDLADVVANAVRLPFADASVAEVLAFDVLEHLSEWELPKVLAELWRVLGPRGRLVAKVPNLARLAEGILAGSGVEELVRNVYCGHRFGPEGAFDAHHWGWTPETFQGQLERAGFVVLANDGALNMTVVAERQPTVVRPAPPSAEHFDATVVIPVYLRADLTRRCLERLASVDAGASFEVVIVDNGSADGTARLLGSLGGDVTVVTNWVNLGFARACNQGARLARAQRVVFLNNDVEVEPGWLGALCAELDSPGVGAAGALLTFPDGTVQHAGVVLAEGGDGLVHGVHLARKRPLGELGPLSLRPPVVTGALMAVRRDAFSALGGFDEGYWNGNEDVDLCLRLREAGWEVALAPSSRGVHHESASGAARFARAAENVARLNHRWRGRLPEGVEVRRGALLSDRPRRQVVSPPRRGGLNVVGYLNGALGLGEAARSTVQAAELAGVPVATVAARGHYNANEVDFVGRGEPFEFDTTLVVANPDSFLHVVREVGVGAFSERYVAAQWVWELEEPSADMRRSATLVHEIWTPSEFSAISMRDVAGARPVLVIPYPVPVPTGVLPSTRAEVGMPDGFVFAYVMDFNSTAERKNPIGLLDAFGEAFQPGEGPTLYLKTMNGARYKPAAYAEVLERAKARSDVVLVDADFSASRAAAIPALADCYVSLHRSEGFGLTIAQAMAWGKPVVATGYSGSLEVTGDEDGGYARLVPWTRSAVPAGTPVYPAGATWADPDVEAAARAMRWVYEHPEAARAMGARGRARIAERFSYERIGSQVAARLAEIAELRYGTARLDRSPSGSPRRVPVAAAR